MVSDCKSDTTANPPNATTAKISAISALLRDMKNTLFA